ncbi:MAG TPA: GNAT family N-acetyltransferase [Symbiobacteriaceae bacterium]|nr:GNAT family N-acetyltransferase [Symbiobacteriaceae bacterium]
MQPVMATQGERERALLMEQVIRDVRRLWFGALAVPLAGAVGLVEGGGEMIVGVDTDGPGADRLIAGAADRGAYVLTTSLSRPADLGARLRLAGYAAVQSHVTYVLDETAFERAMAPQPPQERRRGLLTLLWRREPVNVEIRQIGPDELPRWNAVCWRAFGGRTSEAASLLDKQTAFGNMGSAARWYLAVAGARPVGTAIVYQGEGAAQVLAVGTLPALQSRGVATAVMKHLVRDWQAGGSGFLFLDTSPGSTAERLYLRLGFRPSYLREVYAPSRTIP